jgi:SAM-dependent methyltransferase
VTNVMTAGQGWSAVAEAYRDTFAPLCAGTMQAVLKAAGLRDAAEAGIRVLDVGAGTGTLAAAALECGAEVTAVDPDPEMLEIAAATAPDARLHRAGLPDLPFADGSFDVVLANFVVNHLPDPRAGVREMARLVRPGGRVVATIWPSGQTDQSRLWSRVIEGGGAHPVPSARLPRDRDFPRTVEGTFGLMRQAGLRKVSSGTLLWEHRSEADALWRGAEAGIAGIGTTVVAQTDAVRARMKAEYERLVRPLLHEGELVLRTRAVLAVGTRR